MKPADDSPEALASMLHGGGDVAPSMASADDGPDEALPPGLQDAGSDLMDAVHGKDSMGVAHALRNAWSLMNVPTDNDDPVGADDPSGNGNMVGDGE